MQTPTSRELIAQYLTLLNRGKYFVIVPVIVAVICGSAIAFKLPPVYRSTVKLFYIENKIPGLEDLRMINMYLEAVIVFVEAFTFSMDNSLEMIAAADLYPDLMEKIPNADIVAHMKSNYLQNPIYTQVAGTGGKSQDVLTGVECSFEHTNPQKAYQFTNLIASNFIKYFKQFRETFARNTSTFFEDERVKLKEEIALIDAQISKFKEKNVNVLPELFQSNFRMLDTLNNQLFNIEQEIQLLRGQKRSLEVNVASINPLLSMKGMSGAIIITPEEKLAALTSERDLLLTQYSRKHPDIIRLNKEMAALTRVVQKRKRVPAAADNGTRTTDISPASEYSRLTKNQFFDGAANPAYIQLLSQMEEIDLEIARLKRERAQREDEIKEYERRLEQTPLVEKKYTELRRDLESAQRRYQELSSQVFTLESSQAMEKREMGGKLTIGQPASFPLRPIKPNRLFIIGSSFIAGLALGVAMLLGWDFLTQTIRTPQDFARLSDIAVLSEVPLVGPGASRAINRRVLLKYGLPLGALLVVLLALYLVHSFYLELDVLFIKILKVVQTKIALWGL